jgi:hypothetical protein
MPLISLTKAHSSDRPLHQTAAAPPKGTGRLSQIDFTKGALVLIMALYHWLNYFVLPPNSNYHFVYLNWFVITPSSLYKYLRFLPPSFIFITGFLISHLYVSEHRSWDQRIPGRLLRRGLKLLMIVMLANMATGPTRVTAFAARVSSWNPEDILFLYLTGIAPLVFYVLVPIAYLLIVSAGLLICSRYYHQIFHVMCAVSVACALLLEVRGLNSGYLQMLSIGMIGISIGYIPIDRISQFAQSRLMKGAGYTSYLIAITFLDIYVVQIIGVCLSLANIYRIGVTTINTSPARVFILLGHYSLFGYIIQIVILQILQRSLRVSGTAIGTRITALLICISGTILCVALLDRLRATHITVNKAYVALFA